MKDIINEPFILTEYGQGYRRVFDKEIDKKSLEITPVLEIGRTDIITTIIARSNMNIEIWKQLIYHKNKWMSKSLKTFIDYVKEKEFSN